MTVDHTFQIWPIERILIAPYCAKFPFRAKKLLYCPWLPNVSKCGTFTRLCITEDTIPLQKQYANIFSELCSPKRVCNDTVLCTTHQFIQNNSASHSFTFILLFINTVKGVGTYVSFPLLKLHRIQYRTLSHQSVLQTRMHHSQGSGSLASMAMQSVESKTCFCCSLPIAHGVVVCLSKSQSVSLSNSCCTAVVHR